MRFKLLVPLAIIGLCSLAPVPSAAQKSTRSPLDVMLALENSGSMKKNDPNSLVRQALSDFASRISPDSRIGIVLFDQNVRSVAFPAALVAGGQLTADQARLHPQKNEALQAIGMPYGIVPDVNLYELGVGDLILLCSDGLWEALSDDDIREVLGSDGTMRQLATQLVDRANAAGVTDHITAVLYEHEGTETRQ